MATSMRHSTPIAIPGWARCTCSAQFRNKRSIVLDLKKASGVALLRLAAAADVLRTTSVPRQWSG